MSLPGSTIGLPRHRNGKTQSCESCRKAKAACDHELPVCQRCIWRRIAPQCIYHPGPLTRTATSPLEASRVQKRSKVDPSEVTAKIPDLQRSSVRSNVQYLVNQPASDSGGSKAVSSEFLGPCSYPAVFRENQANLE